MPVTFLRLRFLVENNISVCLNCSTFGVIVGCKKLQIDKSRGPNFTDLSFSLYLMTRTYPTAVILWTTSKGTRNAYSVILTHVLDC